MGGARPFGVSIMFAGIDEKPCLFVTDPTGIFFEYKATAIGEAEQEIKDMLNKYYKDNITIDEGLKLALRALKTVLNKNFSLDRIDGAYISLKDKTFSRFGKDRILKSI